MPFPNTATPLPMAGNGGGLIVKQQEHTGELQIRYGVRSFCQSRSLIVRVLLRMHSYTERGSGHSGQSAKQASVTLRGLHVMFPI